MDTTKKSEYKLERKEVKIFWKFPPGKLLPWFCLLYHVRDSFKNVSMHTCKLPLYFFILAQMHINASKTVHCFPSISISPDL